ncbi:MAG TPA: hypothetical protein VKK31_27675 [Thermoanaerobaculia bacterium]|nr:hypothetical protein [Thermoanaerobaculia bacterium]
MIDREQAGGILFLALFCLMVVILVLGGSVLIRLRKEGTTDRQPTGPPLSTLVGLIVVALLFAVAFLSTFVPYLALIPAAIFCVRGFQALSGGDPLDRDGGILLMLVGIEWAVFIGLQANLLAWGRTVSGPIRLDLVVTLLIMILVSAVGWGIHDRLRSRSRGFSYDGRTRPPR